MNPNRVDFLVDLAYGVMIFAAIILFVVIGTNVGVAFGLGVLLSYMIHVVWKMARFDPDWMTREVTETVEQTVDQTVGKEVSEVIEKLENINDRVDRRPRTDEIEAQVEEKIEQQTDEVEAKVEEKIEQQTGEVEEKVEEKLEQKTEEIETKIEEKTADSDT